MKYSIYDGDDDTFPTYQEEGPQPVIHDEYDIRPQCQHQIQLELVLVGGPRDEGKYNFK